MKKLWLTNIALFMLQVASYACTVCGKQQPKLTKGITHGTGPESDWDYVIIGCVVFIVLISFFYAVKWILYPGEKQLSHIKHSNFILE